MGPVLNVAATLIVGGAVLVVIGIRRIQRQDGITAAVAVALAHMGEPFMEKFIPSSEG